MILRVSELNSKPWYQMFFGFWHLFKKPVVSTLKSPSESTCLHFFSILSNVSWPNVMCPLLSGSSRCSVSRENILSHSLHVCCTAYFSPWCDHISDKKQPKRSIYFSLALKRIKSIMERKSWWQERESTYQVVFRGVESETERCWY